LLYTYNGESGDITWGGTDKICRGVLAAKVELYDNFNGKIAECSETGMKYSVGIITGGTSLEDCANKFRAKYQEMFIKEEINQMTYSRSTDSDYTESKLVGQLNSGSGCIGTVTLY
jgi:hypothetical protein